MVTVLDASHVFFGCPATTSDEALAFIADKACELGLATSSADVLEALKAREAEGSTGMMSGFAIPHCKSAAVKAPAVMVVKFAGDVDWKTMDKQPVSAAIVLLIPDGDAGAEHLGLLSRIAVLLMHEDFCKAVLASTSADEICAEMQKGLEAEK